MSEVTVLSVRLPSKLVAAIDSLIKNDGLGSPPSRSTVIREMLTEQVRSKQRMASR